MDQARPTIYPARPTRIVLRITPLLQHLLRLCRSQVHH
jgi:hypothetical protein